VRDWADAADARHQAGHLIERPAFGELLKATHLRDVEMRVLDLALIVEHDGDLAVAFQRVTGSIVMVCVIKTAPTFVAGAKARCILSFSARLKSCLLQDASLKDALGSEAGEGWNIQCSPVTSAVSAV